jgi:hypothetical protein
MVRRVSFSVVLVALAACSRDPITWNDAAERHIVVPAATAASPSPDATADSILQATLRAAVGDSSAPRDSTVPGPAADVVAASGMVCPGTLRTSVGPGAERAATWWAQRADRPTVELLASRSADRGATWTAPVRVDTLDAAGSGCAYAPPALAVDARNGYAHIAYGLQAPEGTGVFYAHRMDPRGPFEPPKVIIYGDRATAASVASAGDLVVVAYEDPNTGGRPFVSVALSRTAGHSFDERFAVSSGGASAERPRVVIRNGTIAVGWVERTSPRVLSPTDDPNRPDQGSGRIVVVRVGRLR